MDKATLSKISNQQGKQEALIVIKGYLSDEDFVDKIQESYCPHIRKAGWKGSIYHLWWDASNIYSVIRNLAAVAQTSLITGASAPIIAGGMSIGARYHWSKIKNRAKKTGKKYAIPLIQNTITEKNISIMGHSLGARVAYYILKSAIDTPVQFRNVYLLGGAIRRDSSKDWSDVTKKVNGCIFNIYNQDDIILSTLFKMAELGQNPCGLQPIKEQHHKIQNIDATRVINSESHSAYRKHLYQINGLSFHR